MDGPDAAVQLLQANRASLDMQEVGRYFALFERETLLEDLLAHT